MSSSRQKEKNKLDRVFSRYIRLRDSDEHGNGRCITCGKSVFYKDADAGHFRSRSFISTRWHPSNVSLQCKGCNMSAGGEQYKHGLAIDAKFGQGTADMLDDLSRISVRLSEKELKEMIMLLLN